MIKDFDPGQYEKNSTQNKSFPGQDFDYDLEEKHLDQIEEIIHILIGNMLKINTKNPIDR